MKAQWWEKYLSKSSLIKHTSSWYDKLIVLWTLNRQAKNFLRIPDNYIRDKVKVLLDLSNYTLNEELECATGVDTSHLPAKKSFFALKAEVAKLDITKLVPTNLKDLKTNVDDLGIGKLKTVPTDLKKLNDVVSKEVVKNTKSTTLNTKVNNFDKRVL